MVSRASSPGLSPQRARGPTCAWSSRVSGRISSRRTRAPNLVGRSSLQAWSRSWRGLRRNAHEEKRVADKQVSFPADRREDQGARRLARQDAQPAAWLGQGSRSRSRRGGEVARGAGGVARRTELDRGDLQERREDDLRQGGGAEGSFASLQLQP